MINMSTTVSLCSAVTDTAVPVFLATVTSAWTGAMERWQPEAVVVAMAPQVAADHVGGEQACP